MRTSLALALVVVMAAPRIVDAACVPGFDYALFARNTVHIQGNAGTDSYDSAVAPYATANACDGADIGSNSTAAGAVHVQSNSTDVCGDAFVGAGGSPGSVITGNGNILGTRAAQGTNLVLGNVTIPALPPAAVPN
ncbi:MAG TPA: hypothetical protein VK427_02015, partial [Kofleriaceae bacterium]|nr:hypothetical protein [Kofleriaceae bacterium]